MDAAYRQFKADPSAANYRTLVAALLAYQEARSKASESKAIERSRDRS